MQATAPLQLEVGLKTDPLEYRYSYDWLFRLLAEEDVKYVQLGTFFELYMLPDAWFHDLRRRAADHGVRITSVFTAHRELGGFFRDDGPGWDQVAQRNMERLIDVAALVGAESAGSNPGAVLRDRLGAKRAGTKRYLSHFKELMRRAGDGGLKWLTIEPMSCLAEPPTLPGEMDEMARELDAYHRANPATVRPGYCIDVAHGYADSGRRVVYDHFALMRAGLPLTSEVHLKNTDALYNSTFGFTATDRQRGIIDITAVRSFYEQHTTDLPVCTLIGYLEVGGPKLGRDYTDTQLAPMLRESLRYLRQTWQTVPDIAPGSAEGGILNVNATPRPEMQYGGFHDIPTPGESGGYVTIPNPQSEIQNGSPPVQIAPSLMCADLLNLEHHLGQLVAAGAADMLHMDVMDGHFAPNLTLGLTLIEQLRPKTNIPFDVHLMVENPELFIPALLRIGVERVSIHAEAATHLDRLLTQLRDAGVKAGVALNPATPLSALDYVLDSLDFMLVMTVNPGFAGQTLCRGALRKIANCRRLLAGRSITIQVDGNVSFANIPAMVAAGADELVAGSSSIFSSAGSLTDNARRMREAIAEGLAQRPGIGYGDTGAQRHGDVALAEI